MRKCPKCDAINQDHDPLCGICGASLSGTVSEDLKTLEAEIQHKPATKPKLQLLGILALVISLSVVAGGFFVTVFFSPIGILLILGGALFFMYAFGIEGAIGGRDKVSYVREKVRELEAEKKREHGESD